LLIALTFLSPRPVASAAPATSGALGCMMGGCDNGQCVAEPLLICKGFAGRKCVFNTGPSH
jgi:hypothetical protein